MSPAAIITTAMSEDGGKKPRGRRAPLPTAIPLKKIATQGKKE